jgi:hypothetical protein
MVRLAMSCPNALHPSPARDSFALKPEDVSSKDPRLYPVSIEIMVLLIYMAGDGIPGQDETFPENVSLSTLAMSCL